MNSTDERPLSVDRVPTLTEVVELGGAPAPVAYTPVAPATQGGGADLDALDGLQLADGGAWSPLAESRSAWNDAVLAPEVDQPSVCEEGLPSSPTSVPQPAPAAAPIPAPADAATLVTQVLCELMPSVDLLFEAQFRDALAPALARAVDDMVRDTRADMSAAMRSLVEQAVARVLEQRGQG